jgi:RNA polymerase sigma-70 factor (ECF subfamily)
MNCRVPIDDRDDRKGDIMATATPSALRPEFNIEKRGAASHPIAEAQQENVLGQDEAALVLAAKRGNGHAFEILIERYHQRTLAVARRFTRVREDAEDIVQQSFQKAFVHLHRFEEKSSFSTWLTRIAINEALMFLRKSRSLREVPIDHVNGNKENAFVLEISDSREGPESAVLQSERARILFAAMNRLTPGTRKAIELRELRELSTEEAAQALGLSVSAMKARVFHGRKKLLEVLKREPAWMSRKGIFRANV